MVGLEATRALEYAHRRGFVHRDVKPANLLFGEDGRLRVADFGLARALAEAAWTEPQGAVLGTARYASPEQAQGESVDGRADVYSLGLVLIEAVTGTVPFTADTTIATLMGRVGKPVSVPEELGPLRKALERAGQPLPADRPDAGELAVALMACAEDMPRPAPLKLHTDTPAVDPTAATGVDATMLGTSAHAPSRLAGPGDLTAAEAAVPVLRPADDDLFEGDLHPVAHRRRWPVVLLTIVLAGLLGIGAAWAALEARTPRYEVPVLVGNTEEVALQAIDGYGWKIDRREDRKDGSAPGAVLRTDPAAGEQLKKGDTLVLYVSLGNELAPVPADLVGKAIDDATAALQAAGGFVPKIASEAYDEAQAAGIVLAVAPESSGDQPKGSEILLTVSKGPEPRTVPSGLAGGTYEAAAAALAQVQLNATKVEAFSDTVDAGKVIELQPGEGQPAARDSAVEVVVSKGPDLVAVPSVKGTDLNGAIATLEAAGFQVGEVFGPARGQPFDTDPPAGTKAKRGSTVDIYLRR
jgi:serine/threonine-protein kinase